MKKMKILIGSFWFLLMGCLTVDSTEDKCVAEFDCTTLHADAFGDGKKCYYPETSSSGYTRDQTITFCDNLAFQKYNQWSIINPRTAEEHDLLSEKLVARNKGFWWIGQHDRDLEQSYKNYDDPADCPGVFLDWQINDGEPSAGTGQKCVVFTSKEDKNDAFNNRDCGSEYGVVCKAISSDFAEEVPSSNAASATPAPCAGHRALGMESSAILDSQISESSVYNDDDKYRGLHARLNNDKNWAPKGDDSNKYVQVDLTETTTLKGIQIQGAANEDEYVRKLKVYYKTSASDSAFSSIREGGSDMEFTANSDKNSVVTIIFPWFIEAQVIRIVPTDCNAYCSLRMEILECSAEVAAQCDNHEALGMESGTISDSQISQSSYYNDDHNYLGKRARLNNNKNWTPKSSDNNKYIQVDLTETTSLKGIQVQGSSASNEYVKMLKVYYKTSASDSSFASIRESGSDKVFTANNNKNSIVTILFPSSIEAQVIKIVPTDCKSYCSLRMELLKCSGGAGAGAGEVSAPAQCNSPQALGMESGAILDSQISESSYYSDSDDFKGKRARLNSNKNWSPKNADTNKYIQVDLTEVVTLTQLKIQGSGTGFNAYVKKLKVYYKTSASDSAFTPIRNEDGSEKEYPASTNMNSIVDIVFPSSVVVRVLRVVPTSCYRWCSFRMELIGCLGAPPTEAPPAPTQPPQSKCKSLHSNAIQKTPTSHQCYITRDAKEETVENLNFQGAVDYCKQLDLGGYDWKVPDILNNEESEFLRNTVANGGAGLPFNDHDKNFWAGQNARATNNQWTYLNQRANCPPVYLKWNGGDPNDEYATNSEDCVLMYTGGGFVDTSCGAFYKRTCEMTIPDSAFQVPLELSIEVLPFDDPNGGLFIKCNIRVSDVANTASTVRWYNMVTNPETITDLPSGSVSVSSVTGSSCSQTKSIEIPTWLNSEFSFGRVQCEAGGHTAKVVIERATVKSLDGWFDTKAKELRLTCTITTGHPVPKVRWTLGSDTEIEGSSGRYTITNVAPTSTLIISDYNPVTDDGQYRCSAIVANQAVDHEVINAVQPRITSITKQETIVGYNVTCNAMSSPSSLLSYATITAPTSDESFSQTKVNSNGLEYFELQATINVEYTKMDDKIEVCCIAKDSLTNTSYDQQCVNLGCECRGTHDFYGGSCYRYSNEDDTFSWQKSGDKCVDEGSHLVHIETNSEQEYLESIVADTGFWIGLRKDKAWSSETRWEPGLAKPMYTNYARDPSTVTQYTCYTFQYSNKGDWRIKWCSEKIRYMCEHEIVKITSTLQSGTPMIGQDATLECQAIGACADFGIIWQHQSISSSGQVTVKNITGTTTTRTGVTQSSTLVINNYEDETNDGIYNCLIVFNNELIMSPDTPVVGAGILNTTSAYDAKSNTYKLECIATGTPVPNLSWEKDGDPFTADGVTVNLLSTVSVESLSDTSKYEIITSTLEISGFLYDGQESTYGCKIDVNGQVEDTQVIVAYQYPPSIVPCDDMFENKCYIAVNELVTLETAEKRCQKNYGGHLATIGSPEEKTFIADLIQRHLGDYSPLHLWQGFRHNTTNDAKQWYTVDGSSVPTTYFWDTTEPSTSANFDCGALVIGTSLHAARLCTELYGYICVYNEHGVQILESGDTFVHDTGAFSLRCRATLAGAVPPDIVWTRNGQTLSSSETYQITTTANQVQVRDSVMALTDFQDDIGEEFKCLAMAAPNVIGDEETFAIKCPWNNNGFCENYLSDTDMCYVLVNENKNWDDANGKCLSHYGGFVTDVQNQAELDHIKDVIQNMANEQSAWLGIKHEYGQWRNGAGDVQTFFNWQNDEVHDDECVVLNRASGKFVDVPCTDLNEGFVCKYDKDISVVLSGQSKPITFGKNIDLRCKTLQQCVHSFQWTFQPFDSSNIKELSSTDKVSSWANEIWKSKITITQMSESDQGTYRCYANFTTGLQKGAAINISSVSAAIQGIECDKDQNTTTVICQATGYANPVIKWRTTDSLIDPSTSDFTVNENVNGNTLTSRLSMSNSQSHMIFCTATELNSFGYAEECLYVTSLSCEHECREDQTSKSSENAYQYQYNWPRIPNNAYGFEFQVRASMNVHMALASDKDDSTISAEIVLGGWSNTKSALRSCKQCDGTGLIQVDTNNILSSTEFTTFFVEFSDGLVQVGTGVNATLFMSYQFPAGKEMNYIGLSTGNKNWGTTGTWKFCEFSFPTVTTTQVTTTLPTTTVTTTLPTTTVTTTLPTTSMTTTLPTTSVTTTLPTTTMTTSFPTTSDTATIPTTTMKTTLPATTKTATLPTTTRADTTTMAPTTTPSVTTTVPPTTRVPTTKGPCFDVNQVVDMKERVGGNLCNTHIDFLVATNKAVEKEIDDGHFKVDEIDEVFDYLKQAPILDEDIEEVAMASQEAAHLSSKLLDVKLDENEVDELKEMGSQQQTLIKTTDLFHEYSHKLPKGNCLSTKRPGKSMLSSDFCNVNTPKALKYYEFREESTYSSDEYEDTFSLEWSKVPDILENDDTYFVTTHARLEPRLATTTSTIDKTINVGDNDVKLVLNSETITFSLWSNNTKVSAPCYITLQHKESVDTELPSEDDDVPTGTMIKESVCVYWDVDAGNWSTYGCEKTDSESSAHHTSCYCNHTTSFAVLMQVRPYELSKGNEVALTWITYIGCSISLILLLFTTYVYWYLRMFLWSDRIFIHQNLILSIILAQCLFLGGINQTENEKTCKIIAVFLHLFYLAVFSWMLAESFHLYSKVVRVFGTENTQLTSYMVMGWGVPIMITAISFGAGYDGYGSERSCWLDTNSAVIWAFVAPAVFVVLVNLIILGLVIRIIVRASRLEADVADQYYHIKSGVKAALLLLPIMGVTWLFGLLAVNNDTVVFAYLFTLLNSFQGAVVFLVYCYFSKEVRTAWRKKQQRNESIKIACTTIPEGATVTEHGTVVFTFAGGPESQRNSPIPPSPSQLSKRNSNQTDDIIIEDMVNECDEMDLPLPTKEEFMKRKEETERAQSNVPDLEDNILQQNNIEEPTNNSKRPGSRGSRPASCNTINDSVQMTPDLEYMDDDLEDIEDEITQLDSQEEKHLAPVEKDTAEPEPENDYDDLEPQPDVTTAEDDNDLGRLESSMRKSPLDADDVSVHSKSRMSSARSQKDCSPTFELPGVTE